MKGKYVKMRMAFGIVDMAIAIMFLAMILSSEGGIENNGRMMGVSWFLIWSGMSQILGRHRKGFTIAAIVFYSMGILYNLACVIYYPAHMIIVILTVVFLVLTSVSLADEASFYK